VAARRRRRRPTAAPGTVSARAGRARRPSQGRYHTPWSITIRDEYLVSAGDHLGKALAMLRKLVRSLPPPPDPWAAYLGREGER
jgi:hypothetical protein